MPRRDALVALVKTRLFRNSVLVCMIDASTHRFRRELPLSLTFSLSLADGFPISDTALSRARRTVSLFVGYRLRSCPLLSWLDITACNALAYTNTWGRETGGVNRRAREERNEPRCRKIRRLDAQWPNRLDFPSAAISYL